MLLKHTAAYQYLLTYGKKIACNPVKHNSGSEVKRDHKYNDGKHEFHLYAHHFAQIMLKPLLLLLRGRQRHRKFCLKILAGCSDNSKNRTFLKYIKSEKMHTY